MPDLIPSRSKLTFDVLVAFMALVLSVCVVVGALDRLAIRREVAAVRQEIERCPCLPPPPGR